MAGEVMYGLGLEFKELLGLKPKEEGGSGALADSPPPSPPPSPPAPGAAARAEQAAAAEAVAAAAEVRLDALPVLAKLAAEPPEEKGSC